MRYQANPNSFDPWYETALPGQRVQSFTMEPVSRRNFTIDPKIWGHTVKVADNRYVSGNVLESWEITDPLTLVLHVRKGINWQDKAPVNGRELTAEDIAYSFNRVLGYGTGLSRSPYNTSRTMVEYVESITATDKYTVVFKGKYPCVDLYTNPLDPPLPINAIVPREVVDKYGNLQDWHNIVGTGPFILTDYVSGSSIDFVKNPNYFGYDDRYPKNRLPYVDKARILIITDIATAMSALRTGKIDLIEDLPWSQADNITKSNPELIQVTRPERGHCVWLRVDKAPYDDIRVRKALQMSLDLKSIAASFYGGKVPGIPAGCVGPVITGAAAPYDEWEQEVKDGYAYNQAGAKKLLADAGFPNGFKTTCYVSNTMVASGDIDLYQIIKSYFLDIGVDMTIQILDSASFATGAVGKKLEPMLNGEFAYPYTPLIAVQSRWSADIRNYGNIIDPVYDALILKAKACVTAEEQMKVVKEADYYMIKHQWSVTVLPRVTSCIYQPWLNGFWGQCELRGPDYARFWIDSKLKR